MIPVLTFAAVAIATPALAHGTIPGGEGFYAGLMHPLATWQHFLAVFSLGLFLARYPRAIARGYVAVLAMALAAGLLLAALEVWPEAPRSVLLVGLAPASLVALAISIPTWLALALALACGLALGVDTGAFVTSQGGPGLAAYAGVLLGILLITLNAMGLASLARHPPYAIAVRIAGSWIFAVTLMMLALAIRPVGGAT